MISWTRCCVLLIGFVTLSESSTKLYYIVNNAAPKQTESIPNIIKYLNHESKHNSILKHWIKLKNAQKKQQANFDYDYDTYFKGYRSDYCVYVGNVCVDIKDLDKLRKGDKLGRCLEHNGHIHCERRAEEFCDPSQGDHCRPEPKFPHWNVSTAPPPTTRSPAFVPGWDPLESYDWKGGSVEPMRKDDGGEYEGIEDEEIENQSTEDGRKFSTDYVDFDGLMRTQMRPNLNLNMSFDYMDKNGNRIHKTLTKDGIVKLLRKAKQLKDKRMRAKKALNLGEIANYYLEKLAFNSRSTSESSDSLSNSIEVKTRHVRDGLREKRPKRFQVINSKKKSKKVKQYMESDSNSEESAAKETKESDSKDSGDIQKFQDNSGDIAKFDNSEQFSDESLPKKKQKKHKNGKKHSKPDKLHYIQVGGRIYKDGQDFRKKLHEFRKRMQHFLPKRYHWDSKEFHKLGYFWFNGPQGRDAGPWKLNFKK